MRKFLWVMALPLSLLLAGGGVAAAQSNKGFPYNADERAVGPYTLEDPLCFTDGRPVRCKAGWKARRSEILSLFEREMYGRIPGTAASSDSGGWHNVRWSVEAYGHQDAFPPRLLRAVH